MRSAKCGGKHAYHTAWGYLQKTNAKQPSKQRRGEGYSLSLSLSRLAERFLKPALTPKISKPISKKIHAKSLNFAKFFKFSLKNSQISYIYGLLRRVPRLAMTSGRQIFSPRLAMTSGWANSPRFALAKSAAVAVFQN